jgi:hypothetical protein
VLCAPVHGDGSSGQIDNRTMNGPRVRLLVIAHPTCVQDVLTDIMPRCAAMLDDMLAAPHRTREHETLVALTLLQAP